MSDDPVDPAANQPRDEDARRDEGLDLARTIARGLAGRTRRLPRRSKGGTGGSYEARRNEPGRPSGAHPDERDPQTIDVTLERLVADQGWSTDLRVHGVFARWSAIVGRDIAEHSKPESFADGRLVVRADSTAWATQLTLLAGSLVRRLNDELGDETVRVIDVQGPRGPSWRKGRLRVKGRGPRDTYG
jgi:predicted nucleic acid-binding Zn ribbon protein